jgi:hypothetical protein
MEATSEVAVFPGPRTGSVDNGSSSTVARPDDAASAGRLVDNATNVTDSAGNDTADGDAAGSERKPFLYRSLFDWYTAWLAKTIERRLDASGTGTLTWCPRWWAHPEVHARLEALWRAWEVARHQDGDAPARWFGQLDANLKVLMDAKLGPMADCDPDTHRRYANTRPLPGEPAPPEWWGTSASDTHGDDAPGAASA